MESTSQNTYSVLDDIDYPDVVELRMISLHIKNYGVEGAVQRALSTLNHVQEFTSDGNRRLQTNMYQYKFCLIELKHIMKDYMRYEDEVANLVEDINNIHSKNLEFEKEHETIDYVALSNKKPVKRVSKKKDKTGDLFPELSKIKKATINSNLKFKLNININHDRN